MLKRKLVTSAIRTRAFIVKRQKWHSKGVKEGKNLKPFGGTNTVQLHWAFSNANRFK
jgi:hypothetical protein